MTRLVLTTCVSSAGRIKRSRIADRVIAMEQRLVIGPLPTSQRSAAFFDRIQVDHPDAEAGHWQSWIGMGQRERLGNSRPSLAETCRDYDRVDIWIDPTPNAYLILFHLLDALRPCLDILERVSLAFPARPVNGLSGDELAASMPVLKSLTAEQRSLASGAWAAHSSPTPEAWLALLDEGIAALPGFRSFLLRILAELPSARNGLAVSEARLLGLIETGCAGHNQVFTAYLQSEPPPTLDYWEAGQRIVDLSRCEPPLILGVDEDRFTLELHDDTARYAAYLERTWSLSPLGQRIVAGKADLTAFIPTDRWLGNTHLTPERLWRWDEATETLIDPA